MNKTITLAREGKIDEGASIKDQHSIIINAPVEKVWAILTNIQQWQEWNEQVKSIDLNGGVQEGTHFKWTIGRMNSSSQIQLVDKPIAFAWFGKSWFVKRIYVWSLETDDDQTIATISTSLQGLFAVWTVNHQSVYNELHNWLNCLKKKSEEG